MSLETGIASLMTLWGVKRNIQAMRAESAEKTEAAAVGAAELREVFGDDIDETDKVMVNIGFVEAIMWIRNFVSFSLPPEDVAFMEKWQEKKQVILESRKAVESKPRAAKRHVQRVTSLFPFGALPWERS